MPKNINLLRKSSIFPCTAQELYDWHDRQGALQRLLPPWEQTTVVAREGGLGAGGTTQLRLRLGFLPSRFQAKHLQAIPGKMFEDMQVRGPFSLWRHQHFFSDTPQGAVMEDRISYRLPAHSLLPPQLHNYVSHTLEQTFQHRHSRLLDDILRHKQYSNKPLKILISGASGVLGRELVPFLTTGGHQVWTLVRRKADPLKNEIFWNPATGEIDQDAIPEIDGAIHLAGEYIGLSRWNAQKKNTVIKSRQDGTRLFATTLASLSPPPKVFLSSSAIGYYGSSTTENIVENQPSGNGFLAEVCREWEKATSPAQKAGIRTVFLRMGVALSAQGGALHRLLQIAPLGFPKSFGSGTQITSWISIDDLLSAMLHCLVSDNIEGAVNIVAPTPVSNTELIATLAHLTKRPILPPVPIVFLTTFYGEMAHEIALASCHVSCKKLETSGFVFRHSSVEQAIRNQLGIYPVDAS